MQLLQFHEYPAHRASVMNTIVIDGRETGCMKLEGLGEPVMCIIDPIIAVVLMLKLLKTLQQEKYSTAANTRDIKLYRVVSCPCLTELNK